MQSARLSEEVITQVLDTAQWTQVSVANLDKRYLHKSGNPTDFMRGDMIEECEKAVKGVDHKLGLAKIILGDKIPRILARVAAFNCPKEKQTKRIQYAIWSVLSKAKVPLDGLVAFLDMDKVGYDWKVIALQPEAYKALKNVRMCFDECSGVGVFFRPWDHQPSHEQVIPFTGVVTEQDL